MENDELIVKCDRTGYICPECGIYLVRYKHRTQTDVAEFYCGNCHSKFEKYIRFVPATWKKVNYCLLRKQIIK